MKGDQSIFVFFMIWISMAVVLDAKQTLLFEMCLQKQRYDAILETAVDDAASCLLDNDRGSYPKLHKEEALEVLLNSLYAGFDISENQQAQEELRGYIPLVMVMDYDGLYVWKNVEERWSEKFPYSYECTYGDAQNKKAGIQFTMGEALYFMTGKKEVPILEARKDIYEKNPDLWAFERKESFEEIRNEVIINTMMKKMTQHMNASNRIGKRYGIQYACAVPYIEEELFERTVGDISIFMVFQGYPYGNQITQRYYRVEAAGARVRKTIEKRGNENAAFN
ncbi:MAG: hypothetical protein RR056_06535 [Acetivibrio sp.]